MLSPPYSSSSLFRGGSRLFPPHPESTKRRREGRSEELLEDGKLTGGVALLAFPAQYRVSGVMTFLINQNGVVYQRIRGRRPRRLWGR